MTYRLATFGVIRLPDNVLLRAGSGDPDWQAYVAWLAGGGVPEIGYRPVAGGVVRLTDEVFILADPTDADWQAYQAWLADGGPPEVNYRLAPSGVVRLADGAVIPEVPGNRDWAAYQAWQAGGGESEPPETLDEVKLRRRREVDEILLQRLHTGFLHAGKPFKLLEDDRANLNGAHSLAKDALDGLATWPSNFAFRCADNSFLALPTAGSMVALAEAALATYYACRIASWAHKDAMAAMTTIAAIEARDLASNRPP